MTTLPTNATQRCETVIPEAFGQAIPSSPAELMRFLQQQKQQRAIASSANMRKLPSQQCVGGAAVKVQTLSEERLKKQEANRENYETRLMQMEDFLFSREGEGRMKQADERFKMETEDALSSQLKAIFKEHDKLRLREQIRREVEARKAQELAEREARRRAAEERRAAVVERIRRQQELEEQRKRDEEMARIRILEEEARKRQEEIDRLAADQRQMALEDQLSQLVEQDFREMLERKAWQQREKERLIEWEREQRRKDELEEEQRKLRMAELEEKKRKLELLRQQQQQQAQNSAAQAKAMKEEGERINKQLRIQNRAKFVSKKIAAPAPPPAPEPAAVPVPASPAPEQKELDASVKERPAPLVFSSSPSPSAKHRSGGEYVTPAKALQRQESMTSHSKNKKNLDDVIFSPQKAAGSATGGAHHSAASSSIAILPPIVGAKQMQQGEETASGASPSLTVDSPELQSFRTKIEAISTDSALKDLLKELLRKKRALRLEQRQKNALSAAGISPTEDATLQQRLQVLDLKQELVEQRLQALHNVSTSGVAEQTVRPESASSKAKREKDATGTLPKPPSVISLSPSAPQNNAINSSVAAAVSATTASDDGELFKRIETTLRQCQRLLSGLDGDVNALSQSTAQMDLNTTNESLSRQCTRLTLEISQLAKELRKDFDPLGYADKLHSVSLRLKTKLEEIKNNKNIISHSLPKENPPITSKVEQIPEEALEKRRERSLSRPGSALSRKSPRGKSRPPSASRALSPLSLPPIVNPAESKKITQATENALPLLETKCVDRPRIAETSRRETSSVRSSSKEKTEKEATPAHESMHGSVSAPVIAVAPRDELDTLATTLIVDEVTDDMAVETEAETEIDPMALPGWEDCIYTSMFSAAHHAAFFGFTEVLRFLMKYFDCFIMDKKGRTPLFYAALANRLDCVAALLELGPDWIDVGDENGDAPLHAAAIADSPQVLAFLLSCEAQPDTANNLGKTPSHLARSEEILRLLHDSGGTLYCVDNASHMPLWYACAENRIGCVRFLCERTPKSFLLWQDEQGDCCLHKASSSGHAEVLDILCEHVATIEDLNIVNKRHYTPAHVAVNASVLKVLFEHGANLWMFDAKQHVPLFLASFYGKSDCVAFFLDIGTKSSVLPSLSSSSLSPRPTSARFLPPIDSASSSSSALTPKGSGTVVHEGITAKDRQGDTALHVAAMCGHLACVSLLLYHLPDDRNAAQLTPSTLAKRAGHVHVQRLIEYYENIRRSRPGASPQEIFQTDLSTLSSMLLYYGSRWCLCYDAQFATVYYLDHCTGTSQWDRPEAFDVPPKEEAKYLKAVEIITLFYDRYNPEKKKDIHAILTTYQGNYSQLFISLANRYNVQDLSMFKGVDFDA